MFVKIGSEHFSTVDGFGHVYYSLLKTGLWNWQIWIQLQIWHKNVPGEKRQYLHWKFLRAKLKFTLKGMSVKS